jgi:hypothetical protein
MASHLGKYLDDDFAGYPQPLLQEARGAAL